jgi:hypothetical protein
VRTLPVAGPVLLGVVVGLAWALLAPTAAVGRLPGGSLVGVAPRDAELAAAQDGVLLLLGAGAGLVCGLVLVLRPGAAPVRRSLAVLLGCVLGSALAWGLGTTLGPPSVHDQLAADPRAHLVSPLAVHSRGVLLVWPVVALLVAAAGHLAVGWHQRSTEAAWPEDEDPYAAARAGASEPVTEPGGDPSSPVR